MWFVPWILVLNWEPGPKHSGGVPDYEFEMRAGPPLWIPVPASAHTLWTPPPKILAAGPGYYGTPGVRQVVLEWRYW